MVQLYVRDEVSSVTTYEKNLVGFERVSLQPGESKRVTMTINPRDLRLLNADGHLVVEPGTFKVMVAASSVDTRLEGRFTVVPYGKDTEQAVEQGPQTIVFAGGQVKGGKGDGSVLTDGQAATLWQGAAGNDITFTLADNVAPGSMGIQWTDCSADAEFEIQLSSGGGQFLTVYKGKAANTTGIKTYTFKATTASDARILLTRGKASVAEVALKELKK